MSQDAQNNSKKQTNRAAVNRFAAQPATQGVCCSFLVEVNQRPRLRLAELRLIRQERESERPGCARSPASFISSCLPSDICCRLRLCGTPPCKQTHKQTNCGAASGRMQMKRRDVLHAGGYISTLAASGAVEQWCVWCCFSSSSSVVVTFKRSFTAKVARRRRGPAPLWPPQPSRPGIIGRGG